MVKSSSPVVDLNAFAQQAEEDEAAEQQKREDDFQAELNRAAGEVTLTIRRLVENRDIEGLRALGRGVSIPNADERVERLVRECGELREVNGDLQRQLQIKTAGADQLNRQIRDKDNQISQLNRRVEELQTATRELPVPDRPGWRERLGFEPR